MADVGANLQGDESNAEKVAQGKAEKKHGTGQYDYEDDFIDDSDVLDIIKASKKRSKVDGFFVVKVNFHYQEYPQSTVLKTDPSSFQGPSIHPSCRLLFGAGSMVSCPTIELCMDLFFTHAGLRWPLIETAIAIFKNSCNQNFVS